MIRLGEKVQVFREQSRKWEGTFPATRIVRRAVLVPDGTKVKSSPLLAVIPSEAQPRDSDYASKFLNMRRDYGGRNSAIHLDDEFGVGYPPVAHPEFFAAVKAELESFLSRDVFRLIDHGKFLTKAKLLGGRILRCVKNVGTTREDFKGRFIVQGHRHAKRAVLVQECATLKPASLRIMFSTAASRKLDVWSIYIAQAYTRSAPRTRDVYVRPDTAFILPIPLFSRFPGLFLDVLTQAMRGGGL